VLNLRNNVVFFSYAAELYYTQGAARGTDDVKRKGAARGTEDVKRKGAMPEAFFQRSAI